MRQELNSINYNENYIKFMFKIIIVYELIFVLFWNILYYSNSGVENWFQEKILTAIFVFLSTMALGLTLIYVIYYSLKITGLSKILTWITVWAYISWMCVDVFFDPSKCLRTFANTRLQNGSGGVQGS